MKAQTQQQVSPAQIKAIYATLNKHGLLDQKAELISDLTGGRTESTKELTQEEVKRFFALFTAAKEHEHEKRKAVYAAIWKVSWLMGIIYGDTQNDYEMNKAKLNKFCRERGTIKKNLTEMNLMELNKTHRQFEAMLKKFNEKKTHSKI